MMNYELQPVIELLPPDHPENWDDPIYFDQLKLPDIPSNLLPPIFQEYATALAHSAEIPESLVVMTILGVISASVSKRFRVSPKKDWYESLNIYTLIAIPPANNKSLVLNSCIKPVVDWEKEQAIILGPKIKELQSQRKTEEKIIESLRAKVAHLNDKAQQKERIAEINDRNAALIEVPALPQIFINDATSEALANFVYEQGGYAALFSDEGGIIETLSGLYNGGRANLDILLKGIDGGHTRTKRKDKAIDLNPYLTILLTVQPTIIQNMGGKRAYQGNGALERFLYVLPQSKLGYRSLDTPPVPPELAQQYGLKIKEMLSWTHDLKTLTLCSNGHERFAIFRAELETQLRPEGRLFVCQGWGGKIAGFTLRIAGLLHLAEHGIHKDVIEELTVAKAIKIAEILIEHAIAAYSLMNLDQDVDDAKQVFDWMKKSPKVSYTRSEIITGLRHRPYGKSARLNKSLDLLAERNLLSEPYTLPTRKPTKVYYLNPAILKGRDQAP